MKSYKLKPKDSAFTFEVENIELKNFTKNPFTGVWTMDMYYADGVNYGIPLTTGTDVIKGNGLPIGKVLFIDAVSLNGDVTVPNNLTMYVMEK